MAKTDYDKITRFDKGIRSSRRLNSDGEFLMVKNFDIFTDPFKASPVKGWASEVTEAEKAYDFKSINFYSPEESLYACGKAVSNWFNPEWEYSVNIQTSSTSNLDIQYFDLANMPSTFWDNVNSDGSDIRVTDSSYDEVYFYLGNFDKNNQTGFILHRQTNFYIFYGNADATSSIFTGQSGTLDTVSAGLKVALWLENSIENKGTANLTLDNGTPSYGDGIETEYSLQRNLTDGVSNDVSSDNYTISGDNNWYMTTSIKTGKNIPINTDFLSVSEMNIGYSSTGKFETNFRSTGTNPVATDPSNPSVNTDYLITVTGEISGSNYLLKLYVNGTLVDSDLGGGSEDWSISPFELKPETTEAKIDFAYFQDGSTPTATQVADEYNMWKANATYWDTIGAEVTYSSITPTYDGFALWKRAIAGSTWEMYSSNGGNPVLRDRYATNSGFEFPNFITSDADDNAGTFRLDGYDNATGINTGLETALFASKVFPLMIRAEDKNVYMTNSGDVFDISATASTEANQNFISNIANINKYINSLAVVSDYFDNTWVEYWDMDDNQSSGIFDAGRGEGRVIANVGGTLVTVINNFLDNDNKAGETQSMDVRILDGGLAFKNFITIESPASMSSYYSELWEKPILQHTAQADATTTLFYAKIPADASSTTYHEGIWALAKNKISEEFSLSLFCDTADQGDLDYLTAVGNIPYAIHSKDGSTISQTGSYDRTSIIETKMFNGGNSEVEKKLMGVEITHEELESGQEIKVYFKKDDQTSWTLIGSNTTADSFGKEFLNIVSSGDGLPIYNEIEYKIESTGGSSALTGFKAKYKVLDNNYVQGR